jgi:hypothetical protein
MRFTANRQHSSCLATGFRWSTCLTRCNQVFQMVLTVFVTLLYYFEDVVRPGHALNTTHRSVCCTAHLVTSSVPLCRQLHACAAPL